MTPDPACSDPTHVALFYRDAREYVDGVLGFVAPAVTAGEPVAVAVPGPRSQLLEGHLRELGATPEILDIAELGRNPARLIPAVERLAARHPGQRLHYVGEQIWASRSVGEIAEATRHEALINLAWPEADIRVLCLYDTQTLDPAVLENAQRTHPHTTAGGVTRSSAHYRGPSVPRGVDHPLPPPPEDAAELGFGLQELGSVRALVEGLASVTGLAAERVSDLVLAVNELATNTIRHGPGRGVLRVWSSVRDLVCQVEDTGHITDPLAGRRAPMLGAVGGLGLWTVNQVCDLVEVRTSPSGTVVRVHSSL